MPTPVSSLLHAATMVCSGVYVLVRSWYILEYTPSVLIIILYLGGITTIVSGLIATVTNDIKRVIALSTMSQLAQEIYISDFRHQTICVGVNNIWLLFINSQITKAHISFMKYMPTRYISFKGKYTYNNLHWRYFIYKMKDYFNSFILFIRQYPPISKILGLSVKWIIIINRQLVGISEAIRLILIYTYILFINPQRGNLYLFEIYNIHEGDIIFQNKIISFSSLKDNISSQSEDISLKDNISSQSNKISLEDKGFNEWLSGLIDGDGYFNLSKQGTARLQITMDIRDEKVLRIIKNKYGGTIRKIANANALRYQLSHKKGLIKLINNINGNIRNPSRMLQMNKLCVKYGIELIYPKPLTFNNGWFSGIIDSDGSIYLNEKSGQIFISITQKNKYILEPLIKVYSGRIDILSPKIEAFKYIIYRKNELFNLVDNYFNKYPLRSEKYNRINLIKQFYTLYPYRKNQDITKFNEWIKFLDKWSKYNS